VGMIMLIGIVKKNAIMMIDFALTRERSEGISAHDAIVEAALIRFRPIMMTTMAALMGTVPIAIGFGQGGETRRPLGLSVVSGLGRSGKDFATRLCPLGCSHIVPAQGRGRHESLDQVVWGGVGAGACRILFAAAVCVAGIRGGSRPPLHAPAKPCSCRCQSRWCGARRPVGAACGMHRMSRRRSEREAAPRPPTAIGQQPAPAAPDLQ